MSKRGLDFHIDLDSITSYVDELEEAEKKAETILKQEMDKYALFVEEGTRKLVPYDEGDLEESILMERTTVRNGIAESGVGSNKEYALRRHEEPYRKGSFPKYDNGMKLDDYYVNGRGQGTRLKPNWRGMTPGRKYLQNAIFATEPEYDAMLDRIWKRMSGGKP